MLNSSVFVCKRNSLNCLMKWSRALSGEDSIISRQTGLFSQTQSGKKRNLSRVSFHKTRDIFFYLGKTQQFEKLFRLFFLLANSSAGVGDEIFPLIDFPDVDHKNFKFERFRQDFNSHDQFRSSGIWRLTVKLSASFDFSKEITKFPFFHFFSKKN